MFNRLLAWSVLCAACCLLGTGCASTAEARSTLEAPPPSGEKPGPPCGGIAGLPCPEGSTCVDDPRDDCDPTRSGADCIGMCVRGEAKRAECSYDDPALKYVSKSPEQCAAIRFFCEEGYQPFFNDCGCGCEPVPAR